MGFTVPKSHEVATFGVAGDGLVYILEAESCLCYGHGWVCCKSPIIPRET